MSHSGQHRKNLQQPQHNKQQSGTWTTMLPLLLLASALPMMPNAAFAALLTDHNDYDDCSQVMCPATSQCPADSAPWGLLPFDDTPSDFGPFKVLDADNQFADALVELKFPADDVATPVATAATAATPTTTAADAAAPGERSKRALIYADSPADGPQSLTERQLRLCCGPTAAQQCQCKPCAPVPKCGPNTVAVELHKGSGQPGDCCSSYACAPKQQCGAGGQTYWRDQCTRCNCHGASELCHNICPNDEEAIVDESVDQRKGCYSAYWQEPKSHGSSWSEDDYCTECTCNNGERECIAKMCAAVACKRPIKVKGQCCPVCPPADDKEMDEVPPTEQAIEVAPELAVEREDKSLENATHNIDTTVSAATTVDTTTTTTAAKTNAGSMTSGATESALGAESSTNSEVMSAVSMGNMETTTTILNFKTQVDEKTSTAAVTATSTKPITTTTSSFDASSSQSMSPLETASTPAENAVSSTKAANTNDTTFATAQPASSTETTRKTDTTDAALVLQARGGASTSTASATEAETSTPISSSTETTGNADSETLPTDSSQATQTVLSSTTQTSPTSSVALNTPFTNAEPTEERVEESTSTLSDTNAKTSALSTTTVSTTDSSRESSISTSSPQTTADKASTSSSTPPESYSTSSPAGAPYSADSTSTTDWLSTLSFTTSAPAPPAAQPTVYQPIVSILHDPHFQIGIVVAIVFGVCCVLGFGIWKFYTPKRGNAVLKRYTTVPSTETSWSHSPTSSHSSMA